MKINKLVRFKNNFWKGHIFCQKYIITFITLCQNLKIDHRCNLTCSVSNLNKIYSRLLVEKLYWDRFNIIATKHFVAQHHRIQFWTYNMLARVWGRNTTSAYLFYLNGFNKTIVLWPQQVQIYVLHPSNLKTQKFIHFIRTYKLRPKQF